MVDKPQESPASIPTWAFITPSYEGDYRRCVLLCRSMDAFLSGNWHHYVVVDRPHFHLFRHLNTARRSVLLTEDIIPGNMRLLFHLPFLGGRSVWWSRQTGLSIGWHLQQMVKIGIAQKLTEDGLAYCDSDTFFLRPFDAGSLTQEQRFRLYRTAITYNIGTVPNPRYLTTALKLLGVPSRDGFHDYVDNLITWRRKSVLQMCDHLAAQNGGKWHLAFRNRMQISEYMLYGLFVDEVQKGDTNHFVSPESLCKTKWTKAAGAPLDVAAFCDNLLPGQVMVGVQSFIGVDMAQLEAAFERALIGLQRASPCPVHAK